MSLESPKPNTKQALEELQRDVGNIIGPLGYDVVALEQSSAGGRKLTLFIDFLGNEDESRRIGLEDCVTVNAAVDELFETTPLLDGKFNLEVSSPGVERPLRRPEDFERFKGRKVRVHTFRPLETTEIENDAYLAKNKRQKNFVGQLGGLTSRAQKVKILVDGQAVAVPLELISKANLEYTEKVIKE